MSHDIAWIKFQRQVVICDGSRVITVLMASKTTDAVPFGRNWIQLDRSLAVRHRAFVLSHSREQIPAVSVRFDESGASSIARS